MTSAWGAYVAVAVGGALGSVARYWMTAILAGPRFPWGTLAINVLGSFVIGLVAGYSLTPDRVGLHPTLRIFLMTGICGGFTTFSAFSWHTIALLQKDQPGTALANVLLSVSLCLAASFIFRASASWSVVAALIANATGAAVMAIYTTVLMSMIYDRAKNSGAAFRFHFVAEGGWDAGAALGCLAGAAVALMTDKVSLATSSRRRWFDRDVFMPAQEGVIRNRSCQKL